MLTLFGTYILAIAVGAGTAVINDLFFILTLKHRIITKSEINILKQLNKIQIFLIVWIIFTEIVMFAVIIQNTSFALVLGVTLAKLIIELVVLFSALLQRQMYLPALVRYQHTYGHLSDSLIEHSNSLIYACVTSITSWFFIVFITSAEFKPQFIDFGFTPTILVYVGVTILCNIFFVFMKNNILHRRNSKV